LTDRSDGGGLAVKRASGLETKHKGSLVNVTVKELNPCKKRVEIEVDAEKVDETFKAVTKDFRKHANLPGFRPGRAPEPMVVSKYGKDIEEEVKRKLISDHYKKAMEQEKLEVVGYPDIEEVQFGRGQPLLFGATVELEPEFELPEYQGLPAKVEAKEVTDEDVEKAINLLRDRQVSYNTVDREAANGDVVVVNYKGTCDGKPITELAPTAKGIEQQESFWVTIEPDSFIPGFADQLLGAKAGEQRTVNVDFPTEFVTKELAGKKGVYEVNIVEIKEKVLPELDDEFAKSYGAESKQKLEEGVRKDLANELKHSRDKSIRNQLIRALLDRVQFELPETPVAQETRNVVYDIVQENQKRGVSREVIENQKDQIYSAASEGAKERVKVSYLLRKIAEKEDIKVSQEEIGARIQSLAMMYQIPANKFVKDLQKRNGLIEIYDQVMNEKVVNLLQEKAKVEEVPPGTLTPENPEPAAAPA
jgi:trigger factor